MSSSKLRLRHARQLMSFLLGIDAEAYLPDDCVVEVSPSTGKIRRLWVDGKVLATVRPVDGRISLTLEGARRLAQLLGGMRYRVVVGEKGEARVRDGFDVSPADILAVDELIVAGEEVLVFNQSGELLAVGRAVMSGEEMKRVKRGTAVKVRHKV
ncbi:MAG: pseudouridine synthase [Candidatus Caldarchaeum sp.]|nr:pseudouridine synthase [Candidatus Caldarchaeum sp.]